ncbi:sugar transferase [Anabaena sp. UHCC 0253]|uniref:heterocyst development glycosyltransferase HepC n=1 Tax=Anabaena sp. UHCC 0253 TaxID=2590019 RepID=UPI00144764E4|nr:heterocyst development glycosyltransferase HepC [Anabaena sp. UHCC 0253]MTJ55034.1 sugar transferase [Anabaena sp. UHCC 0253]
MTTSVIPSLNNNLIISPEFDTINPSSCTLKWRRGKLLVKTSTQSPQPYLNLVEDAESLVKCLKHSSVNLVSVDPKLGNSLLKFWANACKKANKPIFINIPKYQKLPKKGNQIFRIFQRIVDWNLALSLLLLTSPFMLGLFIVMQVYSPKLLFDYEWYVGEKGQLFQAIKFSSIAKNEITNFLPGVGKYFLENVSNLLNVLQGKFYLINNPCLSLEEVVNLNLEK